MNAKKFKELKKYLKDYIFESDYSDMGDKTVKDYLFEYQIGAEIETHKNAIRWLLSDAGADAGRNLDISEEDFTEEQREEIERYIDKIIEKQEKRLAQEKRLTQDSRSV